MTPKNKTVSNKLLLDTSVQIERQKPGSFTKETIKSLRGNSKLHSSFFVLYEFKTGLVKSIIDFYLSVKLYEDPAEAIAKWSEKFRVRELKNKLILDSIMTDIFNSINTKDTEEYLGQVEATLFKIISDFSVDIERMVGNFGSEEIVRFIINSRSDYEQFLKIINRRDYILLSSFWRNNGDKIDLLLSRRDAFKAAKLETLYVNLAEVKKDVMKADKSKISKSLGDVVISVDCPTTFRLVTLDHSFDIICPALSKEYIKLPKNRKVIKDY